MGPRAGDTRSLRVIVFPGVQNLPHFAAETNGFYSRRGLAIETTFTRSSQELRDGLACGRYDIAHSAVDNAVAMGGQDQTDIAIVVGLDRGFNKLIGRPEIEGYGDLYGARLGVDATNTAFALVAYEMLRQNGLGPADYTVEPIGATRFRLEALMKRQIDVSMLNLPFNLFATRAGMVVLDDPNKVIGDYQSAGGFVKRKWAKKNPCLIVDYLAAYIEGLRWVMRPTNRAGSVALLVDRMKIVPEVAEECYRQISDPQTGFIEDARVSHSGMRTLLELRARHCGGAGLLAPEAYIDEAYLSEALAIL